MTNRIEEVKKILISKIGREVPDACIECHYKEDDEECEGCCYEDLPQLLPLDSLTVCPQDEAFCLSLATQLCQLFPQPLDDEELRGRALLTEEEIEQAKETDGVGFYVSGANQPDCQIGLIWSRRRCDDWAVAKAQLDKALALLQPKIEEERERIISWGDELCTHPSHSLEVNKKRRECSECWQALKGESEQ